jgi:hypothetical protein
MGRAAHIALVACVSLPGPRGRRGGNDGRRFATYNFNYVLALDPLRRHG